MSPGLFGLFAAIAVVAAVIAYAVVWTNRTPSVERDEDEVLPLFSGLGRGNALDSPAESSMLAAAETRAEQAVAEAAARAAAAPLPTASPSFAPSPIPSFAPPPRNEGSRVVTPDVSASADLSPRPAAPAPPAPPRQATERVAAEFVSDFARDVVVPVRAPAERPLIQFTLPSEGTLQFLPGRLEVASGQDSGREIRFVRLPGPNGTEFTFGRSEGEPYRHIRLLDQTVSREHARMRFAAGRWHVQSLSQTNPVIHDGQALQYGEERVLEDGARLEMGEVLLVFRNR